MENGNTSVSIAANCGNRGINLPGGLSTNECKKIINIILTNYKLSGNLNLKFKTELRFSNEIPEEFKMPIINNRPKGQFINNSIYGISLMMSYKDVVILHAMAMEDIPDVEFERRKSVAESVIELLNSENVQIAYNGLVADILMTGIHNLINTNVR